MENQLRGNNSFYSYFLFFLALILIVASVVVLFRQERPIDSVEYEIFFIVDQGRIGIDVSNSSLTFGQLNPGGGARKEVTISNTHNFPIMIEVLVSENLDGLIDVNSSVFVEPSESKTLQVNLNVPDGFELGNYTGKIKFEIYRAD